MSLGYSRQQLVSNNPLPPFLTCPSRSPICVWDLSPGTPTVLSPTHTLGLSAHPCGCKGVSFDPTGSYFASTCDTPSLTVWSSLTMKPCATAQDCFTGTQDLTMFRRIHWSPDGATVAATNCVVANRSCATILSRDGLSTLANLVGHKSAVCAAAYSPDLFQFGDAHGVYLASGDKRGFVTVWCNKESRPVFKLQASARKLAVTDLTWKGSVLVISCLDGSVSCVKFSLPPVLPPSARDKVFKEKYGSAGGVRNIGAMRMRAKEPNKGTPVKEGRGKVLESPVRNHEDVRRLQKEVRAGCRWGRGDVENGGGA